MNTESLRRAFLDQAFSAADANIVLGLRNPYSVLGRLKAAGIVQRLGRGEYRFTPLDTEPVVAVYLEKEAMRQSRLTRQVDLTKLAKDRWAAWMSIGRVQQQGPRRYQWNPRPGVSVRVRRR